VGGGGVPSAEVGNGRERYCERFIASLFRLKFALSSP